MIISDRDPRVGEPFAVLMVCTGNICRSPIAEQLLRAEFAAIGRAAARESGARDSVASDSAFSDAAVRDSASSDAVTRDVIARDAAVRDAASSDAVTRNAIARDAVARVIDSSLIISSAGTHALVGQHMPEQAADLSRQLGGDPAGHAPRLLTAELIEQQDLVLAMSREHRREIVSLVPRASRYTFTLVEFARLFANIAEPGYLHRLAGPEQSIVDAVRLVVPAVASQRGLFPPPSDPTVDDIIDPYRRSDAVYRQSADAIRGAVSSVMLSARRIVSPVNAHA